MTDINVIPVFIAGTILLVLLIFFIVAYLLIHKGKQNRYEIEKSKMIYEHQNKILGIRIEEHEVIMSDISKELQANISPFLDHLKASLDGISAARTDSARAALVASSTTILHRLMWDVRSLSHTMNSEYIARKGLADTLREELEFIEVTLGQHCELKIGGAQYTLLPEKELLIYRIAQEAIHNVLKHARAQTLTITLLYDAEVLTMEVTDNGDGFDKSEVHRTEGIGFFNMMQRTRLLNGILDINAFPGKGCTIKLHVNDITAAIK